MDIRDIILREKSISMTDVLGIVSFVCAMTREQILANLSREIDASSAEEIEGFIRERKSGKPLAYITKKKEFYSQEFYVDSSVLVPRPETEILVEEALRMLEQRKDITRVLDMGTGSGAVGLTIARWALRKVVCVDVSRDAILVARKNAIAMGLSGQTSFVCCDLFDGIRKGARFGMVLANLPYVPDEEWAGLMADVRDFEPRCALCGGPEGAEIYSRFLRSLPSHMKNNGLVLCEVGGARQASLVGTVLESAGFGVTVRNDYTGVERVIIGSWTNLS